MSEPEQLERALLFLGEAFREIREQRGLSVGELAVATGVDEARIADLEEGRLDADYDLLLTLAEGIGVRVSAFFLRAEELEGTRAVGHPRLRAVWAPGSYTAGASAGDESERLRSLLAENANRAGEGTQD